MTIVSKRGFIIIFALPVVFAGLLWFACSNSKSTNPAGSDNPDLTVSKVTGSDCKPTYIINSSAVSADQDCLRFSYGVDGVLQINRINVCFNCCPDSFGVKIDYADKVITITEREFLTHPCDCLCLYDIDYTISGLTKSKYTIKVVEPYVEVSEQNAALEFDVDFSKTPTGEFCVYRPDYPWGIGIAPEAQGE